MNVTLSPELSREVEEIAMKSGLTAEEYVRKIVAEAVEDACDYELCTEILEERERNPVSYTHEEVMREFGLRRFPDPII